MGAESKKAPPLPAPTETETTTPTELTTDISKPGDEKSTYSLPEDGTPVTIRTRGHKANKSQTSLLIEYFEGGKVSTSGSGSGTERKPSVRVRLTPSKKGKGDHFQVTETKGSRKVSLSRRVPLEHSASQELDLPEGEDAHSMTSYASATEESNVSRNPIDIEIERGHRRRRPASPLIPSDERISYQPGNPSEISAIAPDSFLDGTGPSGDVRSTTHSKSDALAGAALGAAAGAVGHEILQNSKTRGNTKERVKISEKSRDKDRSDKKRRSSKSRTSSVSEQPADDIRSPRRRSSRTHQESTVSAGESAVSSYASASHRSLDNRSVRSGTSKSSINNPKLLETVEDAIRRLILPELSALKREQSKRENRRSSLTSTGTSASREEGYTERRRSSGQRPDSAKESPRPRERRNREARHDYDDVSMHSPSRDSLTEYKSRDLASPRRSGDLLKAAAAGAAGAAAIKGISSALDDRSESLDRKHRERRRRRAESTRSRSLGREKYDEEFEDEPEPAPPMPLMSDINPSEVTRTSILSAESERPHSASEEQGNSRDIPPPVISAPSTPSPRRFSFEAPPPLSTQHANVSHGDLTALPRGNKDYVEEYETDEYGRKIPLNDAYYEGDIPPPVPDYEDDYVEEPYDNGYYSIQDVPPPLKYVPYQAGARGLSPIPSVSGYTEAGSEAHLPHNSRSIQSASPDKSPQRLYQTRSIHSMDSIQLSPDNPKNPAFADNAFRGEMADGHEVRGVSANPNFVHPPFGVESAVGSLVDGSMLEQSVVTGASGHDQAYDSVASYDSPVKENARGFSPEKMSADGRREFNDGHATPGSRSLAQSQEYSEYELDENGHKIPRARYRQLPTASEAAITAGAVGAAAAALKAAKERQQAIEEDHLPEDYEPAGVARNKSFKERAMRWHPRNTPTHSLDKFEDDEPAMAASGLPNWKDPMPEIGYVDEDLETNPSIIQGPIDGDRKLRWDEQQGQVTPTAEHFDPMDIDTTPKGKELTSDGLGIKEAAGAAALGAAVTMAATDADREISQEHDEWRRTSDERKRDTLITNPYEDASPITNPALGDELLKSGALDPDFGAAYATGSPGFVHKFDEGYMSNGPNATPDAVNRGKGLDFTGAASPLGDDPFYVSKENPRHLSGLSQGMSSPFYDATSGGGIDRIENKDIVALMQHLMVRDAQRSARDTEIVALLMNAALEMKNSFREMKELVQDTGDDVIFANVENTEKLQKAINGPRPFPSTGSRSLQSPSQSGTADDAKKKNLWKRALQGLSAKGTTDLTRIEDMLVQLLGEVNDLKTGNAPLHATGGPSQSYANSQAEPPLDQDRGYEAEATSTASQSGYSGTTQVRSQPTRLTSDRKFSDHRISTVPENDEEYQYDQPAQRAVEPLNGDLLSPDYSDRNQRGSSVPLDTPPHPEPVSQPAAFSAENTPKSEKGKKHKSSSSSGWLPKISRWSETTASSVGRAFRGSGTSKKGGKYDDFQPPSRSASSLASYDDLDRQHDPYGEDKLHSGFSNQNFQEDLPLEDIPSSYMLAEDPKYKAHRNSVNLQHPQPSQGQTERYRTALEYSAQEYDSPKTPRSTDWAGSATSLSRLPANTNRYSNASSAHARDADYALASSQQGAPPRPPKEPIDNAAVQTPQKTTRVSQLQKDSPAGNPSYESGYGSGTGTQASHYTERSPKFENRNLTAARGPPSRRPSGPRAMTPKSPEEEAAREERRRKRGKHSLHIYHIHYTNAITDTFGTVESQETDTF